MTPGHLATWATTGVLNDAGTSQTPKITSLGIVANGGTPFCISSATAIAAYNQLCMGISGAGAATISAASIGGAPAPNLTLTAPTITLNGATAWTNLLLPNWTNATRPNPPTVGNIGLNSGSNTIDIYTSAGWMNGSAFTGGAVPNATTFGSSVTITGGTLTLAGASSITSSATTVTLNTSNGQGLQIFSNATVANRPTITTSGTSTSPVVLTTTGTGGFEFQSFLEVSRGSIAYSGTSSAAANHLLDANVTFTGASSDTGQYSPNNNFGFLSLQTGYPLIWQSTQAKLGTGFYGQANASLVGSVQTGTPGTLGVWAGNTAYSILGSLIQNGTNEYQLITAGTSAGSGGPTGPGTNITDGTAHWRYIGIVANSYNMSGLVSQSNAAFNVGGSANDFRGIVQGGNSVATFTANATYYLYMVGHEFDCGMASGSSAYRRACVQIVSINAGAQGSFQDAGLTFGGQGSGQFVNGINFADGSVDPNGYAINFWPWNAATSPTMAGAIDMLRVNANGSGPAGGGFIARWANGELTNPTGQTAGGDLYLGYASLHVTSTGLVIDTSLYMLTGNPSALSGGTNWVTGQTAVDNHGNRGTVTASGGVPSAVTITQYASTPSLYTTSTWSPDNSTSILGAGGAPTISTTFTATEATAQVGSAALGLGTGVASSINIGNSGSTTTITGTIKAGSGTGQSVTCTIVATHTLIFTNGILTGGTCNS